MGEFYLMFFCISKASIINVDCICRAVSKALNILKGNNEHQHRLSSPPGRHPLPPPPAPAGDTLPWASPGRRALGSGSRSPSSAALCSRLRGHSRWEALSVLLGGNGLPVPEILGGKSRHPNLQINNLVAHACPPSSSARSPWR